MRPRAVLGAALAAVVALDLALSGCQGASSPSAHSGSSGSSAAYRSSTVPSSGTSSEKSSSSKAKSGQHSHHRSTGSGHGTRSGGTSTSPPSTSPPSTSPPPTSGTVSPTPKLANAGQRQQLPRGGYTILPTSRVVAYYGGPNGPNLGVLGAGTPEQAAAAVVKQANLYAPYGRPVQPAMELIATVAQGAPGPAGTYSTRITDAEIQRYLDAAHRHKMLLILDVQPGTGDFLSQVRTLHHFLLDPSVSLALDPEWKVKPGQRPGNGRIGSSSAAAINAVGAYLSRLVQTHNLPDKLLVIHEFTPSMLPDRQNIRPFAGLEETLHADGEGAVRGKRGVYRQLAFPTPRFHVGFKVFFTEDSRVMTPAEVMALHPRPDMITYQ